jgi:uncharacterized short protein YbdD (DUF466 family)
VSFLARVVQMLRLMVGVPDYARYVAHRRAHHPGEAVLTRAEFVAASQEKRFTADKPRCC